MRSDRLSDGQDALQESPVVLDVQEVDRAVLTAREAAAWVTRETGVDVSETNVRRWATHGCYGTRLRKIVVGGYVRFRVSDLRAFLAEQAEAR